MIANISHRIWTTVLFSGALLCFGCTNNPSAHSDAHTDHDDHHAHAHPSTGPHDGHLIELGKEEYHAELIHDDASKSVTIYLLDGKVQQTISTDAPELMLNLVINEKPLQFKLTPSPGDLDAEGKASRFASCDEQLLAALESENTSGRLNITINGKPYSGDVEHHGHEADAHHHD